MKIATRAAIYSGLIMPGFGQYYAGQRRKGAALVVAVTGLIVWLGVRLFRLVYQALVGNGPMDAIFSNLDEATLARIHSMAYSQNLWILILIIGLWLYSIIDAYLAGRKWDEYYAGLSRADQSPPDDQGASSGGLSG